MTRYSTGQTGEFLVAAELARRGYSVALFSGNAEAVDMLAYGGGKPLAIQVKSTAHENHQFNLAQFVNVELTDDDRQIMNGRKKELDADVIIALVRIGQNTEEDHILWTTAGQLADTLEAFQRGYVAPNGGRRPGKNPRSLHVALGHCNYFAKLNQGVCKSLEDLLSVLGTAETHPTT